ncbi:Uma2 family endonuclease [Pseudonocardia eucalypti]|uniref:Uma2 family endonuclease n=1 Tax=Pseudonocardia eucalypti TaxID=648755 RepID=A0ABP9PUK4_9PSEU|nr:Uma2 family endonuclease [Pseudonocardia eucalypti]
MTSVTTDLFGPGSGPLTVDDLAGMPDDGRRYELLDGVLIVSPAPGRRHQRVIVLLGMRLEVACPDEMELLIAPFAVQPSRSTELQPDLLVAREADLTDKNLPTAPLLAVEVLSPSTTLYDLHTKKAAYERMGVASYWLVDPQELVLTVFEADQSGHFQQVAVVKDEEEFLAERPFPVRVVPAELVRRPGR